jgi:hypothetical protein
MEGSLQDSCHEFSDFVNYLATGIYLLHAREMKTLLAAEVPCSIVSYSHRQLV